ncbi:MAG: hypothetical protein ACE1Y3_00235, partial [Rhodospirillales bacterium]
QEEDDPEDDGEKDSVQARPHSRDEGAPEDELPEKIHDAFEGQQLLAQRTLFPLTTVMHDGALSAPSAHEKTRRHHAPGLFCALLYSIMA